VQSFLQLKKLNKNYFDQYKKYIIFCNVHRLLGDYSPVLNKSYSMVQWWYVMGIYATVLHVLWHLHSSLLQCTVTKMSQKHFFIECLDKQVVRFWYQINTFWVCRASVLWWPLISAYQREITPAKVNVNLQLQYAAMSNAE